MEDMYRASMGKVQGLSVLFLSMPFSLKSLHVHQSGSSANPIVLGLYGASLQRHGELTHWSLVID